jgi:hypothetical protein
MNFSELTAVTGPYCVTKLSQTEFFVAKPGPKNFGYYPQDSFSKDSNMERVAFLETNVKTGDNLNFAVNLGIYSTKAIADKEEIFYEYGRAHWCYRPNFETLSVKGKSDCKKYYKIMPKDIREGHPYVTSGYYANEKLQQASKKGGKK